MAHLHARDSLHHDVQKQKVITRNSACQCLFCRVCDTCLESGFVQIEFQNVANVDFVIYNENFS